jgi:predicted transcriptional regulator
MKVVGEAAVLEIIEDSPDNVWRLTSQDAGITRSFFDSYYENKSKAVAYKLGKVTKYKKPLSLADLGINSAPQSFIYL